MRKVNVLIPTYEPSETHLAEALESLKNQTYTDWTCFIHDDASKKNVESIIAPFLSDERFVYQKSGQNLGIGGNWNACIEHGGDAEIVAFLFQDDRWSPNYLEKGLKVFEQNESVGFVSLDHEYFYEGNVGTENLYDELKRFKTENIAEGLHKGTDLLQWWIENELHPNIIGEPPFVMFRRETLQRAGSFNNEMPQFLDVEYWLRCLQVTDWYYLKQDLGGFRVHPAAASARNEASGQGIYDRLKCFEQLIDSLPRTNNVAEVHEPPLRELAIQARNRALEKMARKYFSRKKEGKSVKVKGSGFMKKFALKHPILVGSAIARALVSKNA